MRRFADSMAWADDRGFAIDAALDKRMAFVRRTYAHLFVEVLAVALFVVYALQSPWLLELTKQLISRRLLYVAIIFGVSLLTRSMLEGRRSIGVQYAAAVIWVVFLGFLVTPLVWLANYLTGSYAVVGHAAVLAGFGFGGLTAYVFVTRKDFSFLRGGLWMVSWILFGVGIIASFLGGFGGGMSILYSSVGVLLMGGWVLHDTSKVLHHRSVDQHVAASVDLLVDFVYMFIYILSILLRRR